MPFFTISKTILRSLFGRPATLMYPAVPREYVEGSRGHIEIAVESCSFCSLCQRKCPTEALSVDRETKIWKIDRLRCIACNFCAEACPKKCLSMATGYSPAVTSPGATEEHHA